MEDKSKETFKKDRDEGIDIACGDSSDFRVICSCITEQGRWYTYKNVVVQRVSDGKFFECCYGVGSTECQEDPEDDLVFSEVRPHAETVVVFK